MPRLCGSVVLILEGLAALAEGRCGAGVSVADNRELRGLVDTAHPVAGIIRANSVFSWRAADLAQRPARHRPS